DAEDGSDRTAWVQPRERLLGGDSSEAAPRDGLIRAVLEKWDFQDAMGWRPLLEQILAGPAAAGITAVLRDDLEWVLERFAQSEICRQLASARACRRDVEFVLSAATGEEDTAGDAMLRGVMDCVWQDSQGDWHLLALDTQGVAPANLEKDWLG